MEFNLLEDLMLLALDDDKGNIIAEESLLIYGIGGGIILQLSLLNKLVMNNKKVKVIDASTTQNLVLDKYLALINKSKKERSVKHWISTFQFKLEKSKKDIINDLVQKGILIKHTKKFLGFIPYSRYPMINKEHEHALRIKLNNILNDKATANDYDLMLLGLIKACSLVKPIFGKERKKEYSKKIEELLKSEKISSNISSAIKEIHEEIIIAITTIMIAVTATTVVSN